MADDEQGANGEENGGQVHFAVALAAVDARPGSDNTSVKKDVRGFSISRRNFPLNKRARFPFLINAARAFLLIS